MTDKMEIQEQIHAARRGVKRLEKRIETLNNERGRLETGLTVMQDELSELIRKRDAIPSRRGDQTRNIRRG